MMENKKGLLVVGVLLVAVVGILVVPGWFSGGGGDVEPVPVEVPEEVLDSYPDAQLSEMLAGELDAVNAVVREQVRSGPNFTVGAARLFGKGEWCGVKLEYRWEVGSELFDTYRVILAKREGVWVMVARPRMVFAYEDYADLPRALIKLVNEM